jgi:CubicO group peptidase (beta-lactamase class C family)
MKLFPFSFFAIITCLSLFLQEVSLGKAVPTSEKLTRGESKKSRFLSAAGIADSSLNPQTKKALIDSLLQTAHRRGFFNGNALVVAKGKVIYQNELGYADGNRKKKLSPDLRFSIGSISKEFDGVGIMLLEEQGKLSLTDKVSRFFPAMPAWSHKITVKDLLQYTSGLPVVNNEQVRTDAETWQALHAVEKLAFEPGTAYLYNNSNTFLRKRIIEQVTGKSYKDFVETDMLEPFGLKNAVVDPAPETQRLARAFDNKFVEDTRDVYQSGWVYVTIQDLYQLTKQLHGYKVISKSSLYALFESYKSSKQSPLGVGRFENGNLLLHYHHGQSGNFEASLYYNPVDDFMVILLTNNRNSNVGDLTTNIDAILRGEPFEIPKKSIEMVLRTEIFYHGFEKGMQWYHHIRKNERDIYDFPNEESELLNTGDYLLEKGRGDDGIKVLKFTVMEFPKSSKAWTYLAEAYLRQGNISLALVNYERAFALDTENKHALQKMEELRGEK